MYQCCVTLLRPLLLRGHDEKQGQRQRQANLPLTRLETFPLRRRLARAPAAVCEQTMKHYNTTTARKLYLLCFHLRNVVSRHKLHRPCPTSHHNVVHPFPRQPQSPNQLLRLHRYEDFFEHHRWLLSAHHSRLSLLFQGHSELPSPHYYRFPHHWLRQEWHIEVAQFP